MSTQSRSMTKEEKPIAWLTWSLYVYCPKCKEANDLADPQHDLDHEICRHIFTSNWDVLSDWEVTCESCGHEFTIKEVEMK